MINSATSDAIFLGITLAPVFTRRSTHLLCPSGTGQKFDKAHEWDIPVVGLSWLSAVTTSGLIPPVDDFIVSGPTTSPIGDDKNSARKDIKGKGKAVDNGKEREASCDMDVDAENRMNDITNNSAFSFHVLMSNKPNRTPILDNPLNCQLPPNIPPKVSPTKHPKAIERQATTTIPNPEAPEPIIFGKPNHTLGSSFAIHPSSIPSPTTSMISPATPRGERSRLDSFSSRSSTKNSFEINNNNAGPSSSSHRQQPQQRQPTVPHLEASEPQKHDDRLGRVPSSTSPSPMKVPSRTGSRLSLSPIKIDHEATKALQESITTLLGKRPSPDGDADEPGGARARGATGADMPQRKKGKRARPQRAKVCNFPSRLKSGGLMLFLI